MSGNPSQYILFCEETNLKTTTKFAVLYIIILVKLSEVIYCLIFPEASESSMFEKDELIKIKLLKDDFEYSY